MNEIILEGRQIEKTFRGSFGSRPHRALDGVSIQLHRGETLGLMGPSGCGKSTLGRILLRLIAPDRGSIFYCGEEITHWHGKALRSFRKSVQLIAQRPEAFLILAVR